MEQGYRQIPIVMPSIFPVTCHTDFVGQGTTFVAIPGYVDNGASYIPLAIQKGAHTIVIENNVVLENDVQQLIVERDIIVERVENARVALAQLSAQAAGFPAEKLTVFGITGTKGKTTTAFLVEHGLHVAGYKTARISSAGNSIDGIVFPPMLTTPQPDYLHQFLKLCVQHDIHYVVMEVAAQALTLHRVKDIQFDGIIFTNFSHEHLEFYPTLDDYYAAKCRIFDMVRSETTPIMVNHDDEKGAHIVSSYKNNNSIRYGFVGDVDYKGIYHADVINSCSLLIQQCNEKNMIQCSSLFGRYNAYNILAAASLLHTLDITWPVITRALATFSGVPGRLQSVDLLNGARAFIDYAHNPSSFEAVLSTLRQMTDHLIVIFGAGGGKDKFKRPIMGALACQYADDIVLTSDNPRLENVESIMSDILAGIQESDRHKIEVCYDRAQAIERAYTLSRKDSIIALLGKGPDEYQIIGKVKYFFSEHAILKQLM